MVSFHLNRIETIFNARSLEKLSALEVYQLISTLRKFFSHVLVLVIGNNLFFRIIVFKNKQKTCKVFTCRLNVDFLEI